jgi:hypothetical protein
MNEIELQHFQAYRNRLIELKRFITNFELNPNTELDDLTFMISEIKNITGNINNIQSFFYCLKAKDYLIERNLANDDTLTINNNQGANGLDFDYNFNGVRIIAELKTTQVNAVGNLMAQQITSITKDLKRLLREKASHKFFFVPNNNTRNAIIENGRINIQQFNQIQIIALDNILN